MTGLADRYDWRLLYRDRPEHRSDGAAGAGACLQRDPHVSALVMSRRVGHQVALVAGMDNCSEDVCVTMDADLQHPPELIPEMFSLYEGGADIVQTVRTSTEGAGRMKSSASRRSTG